VLHPDRGSVIAPLCDPAGAHHLRAALIVGALLAALAVFPMVVQRIRPGQHVAFWTSWGLIMLFAAVAGVALLGLVEYAPESVFFDL